MAERIGDFLVRIGAMTEGQTKEVLDAQKGGDKRSFGDIALALGYVSEASIKSFADSLGKG
ncbi:MAG TPA: hypothetical protein VMV68_01430 [Spirochaetia bacterium]|nr:hypothetical protein [Spirochaetia bacterium]